MFAGVGPGNRQIFVKRKDLVLLLAPVMALAARVVAEPPVPSAFSAVRMRLSKREHLAAVFAAGDIAAGGHEPVHLQIGHT